MGKSIGIDLGTTNSVIGFKDTSVRIIRNNSNEELTRSCVAMNDKKDFLVGNRTFDNMQKYIPNVVTSVKRLMGNSIKDAAVDVMKEDKGYYPYEITKLSSGTDDAVAIVLQGMEYTPEQISAEILRQLKNDASEKLGEEVTHAVITVPAYFNEKQKTATRVAANLAGLKVQRLLAEPTAAAISYGVSMKEGDSKVVLVYDFGGGTFDLSILVISDNNFIEAATGGDRWLGGDNIDKIIKQYIYDEFENENDFLIEELLAKMPLKKQTKFISELRKQIEDTKIQLSAAQSADIQIFGMLESEDGDDVDIELSLTREKFEALVRPLINKTIQLTDSLLETSGYPIDTIDNILLVGGSSCIPIVKKMLSEKYGQEKVLSSEKPMLAIAEGAAILAHDLPEDFECPTCGSELDINQTVCPKCNADVNNITQEVAKSNDIIQVQHTTSHNYYISVSKNGKSSLHKIIDNAEVLPFRKTESFKTQVDNQKIVKIDISADAENGTFERQAFGFYTIQENLSTDSDLIFEFYMDLNQTLDVLVYPKGKKDKKEKVRLTRGNKDDKSLGYIAQSLDNVFGANIADAKKMRFIDDIQKQIEKINKDIINADSDDNAWDEIERIVKQNEREAHAEGSNNELNYIFARIIVENFSKYVDRTDLSSLQNMINTYEKSKDDLEKGEISNQLKVFIEEGHFLIFIHIFLLRISADSASNPAQSNKLLKAYNDAISALDDGNINKVIAILNNTELPDMGTFVGNLTTSIGR